MLNQVVLVGRLARDVEKETIDGKEFAKITLATARSYKNEDGVYDTDFIDCQLTGPIVEHTAEYCKKGDLLGVKGRLENGGNNNYIILVVDKVTFLASKKTEGEDE